ncbi:hypothetical protein [Aestuariivivens sediminis]|uniref:hypothetical protein n=1 Tax=Aestuariivivens sediminis TaxID=2913557 RepID=UPI0030B84202
MGQLKNVCLALVSIFLWNAFSSDHSSGRVDTIGKKVETLLAQMTLEDKLGK